MIPYSYNMVDMGGIDLAEASGTVVEGLYNRLALARNACGDLILYNWKFVGIEIAPSACSTIDEGSSIVINGMIEVTDEDVVTITSLLPPPPEIEPLTATENGVYEAPAGVDGFNPVTVDVSTSTGIDIDAYAVDFVPNTNANQAVSGGFSFRTSPFFSYLITKIRVFARETTVNAYISDSNGNIIVSALNTTVIENQWNDIVLPIPVTLSPNTTYVVWYSMPNVALKYYSGIPTASSGLISNVYGRYSTNRNTFPATREGNTYGVDFFIEEIYVQ